ncbi:hypothetical protein ACFL2B_01815 [Patescibacteria group bacterium]
MEEFLKVFTGLASIEFNGHTLIFYYAYSKIVLLMLGVPLIFIHAWVENNFRTAVKRGMYFVFALMVFMFIDALYLKELVTKVSLFGHSLFWWNCYATLLCILGSSVIFFAYRKSSGSKFFTSLFDAIIFFSVTGSAFLGIPYLNTEYQAGRMTLEGAAIRLSIGIMFILAYIAYRNRKVFAEEKPEKTDEEKAEANWKICIVLIVTVALFATGYWLAAKYPDIEHWMIITGGAVILGLFCAIYFSDGDYGDSLDRRLVRKEEAATDAKKGETSGSSGKSRRQREKDNTNMFRLAFFTVMIVICLIALSAGKSIIESCMKSPLWNPNMAAQQTKTHTSTTTSTSSNSSRTGKSSTRRVILNKGETRTFRGVNRSRIEVATYDYNTKDMLAHNSGSNIKSKFVDRKRLIYITGDWY